MNKKLPKVFANRIDKNILNNEKIYYSGNSDKIESNAQKDNFDNKNIYQKINDIFNSERYVYKAEVDLKLKNGSKKVKIIGHNKKGFV